MASSPLIDSAGTPPASGRAAPSWLRKAFRSSEAALIVLAINIGSVAGLLSVVQGALARTIQHLLYALSPDQRLSAATTIHVALLALPAGGAVLALFSWVTHAHRRRMVDAVEANALHGGRMSWSDSLVISGQTILSNGFGASWWVLKPPMRSWEGWWHPRKRQLVCPAQVRSAYSGRRRNGRRHRRCIRGTARRCLLRVRDRDRCLYDFSTGTCRRRLPVERSCGAGFRRAAISGCRQRRRQIDTCHFLVYAGSASRRAWILLMRAVGRPK